MIRPGRRRGCRLGPAFGLALALAAGAPAQPPAVDGGGEPAPASHPAAFRVAPETLAVVDEAATARETLAAIADLERLTASVAAARAAGQARAVALADLRGPVLPRPGDLRELRLGLAGERRELERLAAAVADHLDRWDELRRTWEEKEAYWRAWDEALTGDPERTAVRGDLARARAEIRRVLDLAAEAGPPLVALQRELVALQRTQRGHAAEVDEAMAERRRRLLRADAPALLSAAHREQLGATAAELPEALARALRLPGGLRSGRPGLLALQLLLTLGLAFVARRAARLPVADERWRRLLARPAAVGLFVATATVGLAARPLPPAWVLLHVALLAASGARLAGALLYAERAQRRSAYLLAGLFTLVSALEAAALPAPWQRVAVAAVCVGGVAGLGALVRAAGGEGVGRGLLRLGLAAGLAALTVALAVETAGLSTLALWLVEGTLATGFVAFVVFFLARLTHGGLLALATVGAPRVAFLRRHAATLIERLSWLAGIGFTLWGLLLAAEIWELTETAGDGWRRLLAAGVGVGEGRLTVGNVLLAAGAVWVAVALSRVLRAALDGELRERRQLEPGVADTVKTLVHYTLLIAGLLGAAGFLGFELGSFALVAGALGVGVGFGLQNVVNNFVSGLILMFERPVRPGDWVEVGGDAGIVRRIGLRSTVLATVDEAEIVVPNSDLISQKVVNWTLSDRRSRLVLPFGVAYDSDLERVRRAALSVAAAHAEVLADPAPSCVMDRFGESSLEFTLRAWIGDMDRRLAVQSDLLLGLTQRFRDDGIEVPFPRRDVQLLRRQEARTDLPPAVEAGPRPRS